MRFTDARSVSGVKRKDGTGRIFYRCVVRRSRALPRDIDHPSSVYVRQEPIVAQLNEWIGTLADPASLAASQDDDGAAVATAAERRRHIRGVEVKTPTWSRRSRLGSTP